MNLNVQQTHWENGQLVELVWSQAGWRLILIWLEQWT